MMRVKGMLLGSAAGLASVTGAWAADLPVRKGGTIEYVRVCTTYGAGFFYIPGTDTCLRLSGRARFEAGYYGSDSRGVAGGGDLAGYIGLLRINVDARTQTDFGTLRAFLRLDAASRTGNSRIVSGTQNRSAFAFPATGQDASGRVQNSIYTEKAFIQIGGLTAGRASSYFDFYAQDYEIIGTSLGSNLASTNLLAWTQKFGEGWSTTISMEDSNFRKNPIYSTSAFVTGSPAPSPIILGVNAIGNATSVAFLDVVQRSRMPDFVGALRYDAPWGSAQLSAAVKDVNTGGFIANTITTATGTPGITPADAAALLGVRGVRTGAQTDYGWAVQAGAKFNLPFIAPGDGLYLQGAYGEGANLYTGISRHTGTYLGNAVVAAGNPFNQYFSDAIVNPLTGKLELARSFTVVASYLHYWSPEWRSAFYGSYGEIGFSKGARAAVSQTSLVVGSNSTLVPPSYIANPAGYTLSPTLRDTAQIVTGASLIWSPVKDLDIGVEGQYIRTAVQSGRVADSNKGTFIAGIPTRTTAAEEYYQARFRVQRDF